jgi:hypothetical protein
MFYFAEMCRDILERSFDRPYFQMVSNAIRLEFASLDPRNVGEDGLSHDYRRLRVALKCDFKQLDYLVKNAADVSPRGLIEEKLLAVYFRLLLVSWAVRHRLRLSEARVISAAEEVLRYLANVVGQQTEALRVEGACRP